MIIIIIIIIIIITIIVIIIMIIIIIIIIITTKHHVRKIKTTLVQQVSLKPMNHAAVGMWSPDIVYLLFFSLDYTYVSLPIYS